MHVMLQNILKNLFKKLTSKEFQINKKTYKEIIFPGEELGT